MGQNHLTSAENLSAPRGKGSSDMRITGVRVHSLSAPLARRFGWSLGWTSQRTATLVEVRTDCGITGWGDGLGGEEIWMRRPELVLGRSVFEVEGIFEALRRAPSAQGRPGPAECGGLDTAIWDALGQAVGLPVSRLIGASHRAAIQPYCTALYRQDWPDLAAGLSAEARGWKARGFRAMKMKIGYSPERDIELVAAVRHAIGPGVGLAVDANCAYTAGTAIALGRRLEAHDLLWWEEPLPADDLAGYARLREQLRIPLAGGETLLADDLIRDYIQTRLVDIVQPEVALIGLTGARRITPLCWLNRVQIVPHNWGTAVRTAAILQWMATVPPLTPGLESCPVTFEFDQTEHPFRDVVVTAPFGLDSDGMIAIPQAPGLGIHVIPEAVAHYREALVELGK